MDKHHRKASAFYPTPKELVNALITNHIQNYGSKPNLIIEPSAGKGDFIIESWEVFQREMNLSGKQLERMVSETILFENDKEIFFDLKSNIKDWCKGKSIKSLPKIHNANFLLHGSSILKDVPDNVLIVGNPPWDEFTTRKHDGTDNLDTLRGERQLEKNKYQLLGYKNLYQCFMHEITQLKATKLSLIFVLPRQLLGDLSAEPLRKMLVESGTLNLTVYCNKDEPSFTFPSVDRAAEILCLNYKRSEAKRTAIRRGFKHNFKKVKPFGSDYTIPCPVTKNTEDILSQILSNSMLSEWDLDMAVSVSRGKVDYTKENYKSATNGRNVSAYQYELGHSTTVILNKILPNSRRKLKAAVLRSKDTISDSMLRITCKNEEVHPYLMLLLNSRPVELALRSVISNINLNNFRLMSLPIPQPDSHAIQKAKNLCQKCKLGEMTWEDASDQLAKHIYGLSKTDLIPLKELFPDRDSERLAA